jgi:heme-degrading monooxygenase HmoA
MFSVVFEVLPAKDRRDDYLELARHLKPSLESTEGFVDNERFESQLRPGWVLSHSTWRNEKSLVRWRTEGAHHRAQGKGRFEIFQDYHLRIGETIFDTASDGKPLPQERFDETEVGAAKFLTLTEITPRSDVDLVKEISQLPEHVGLDVTDNGLINYDCFAGIYNPGKLVLLISWISAGAAERWALKKTEVAVDLRHRTIRVVRDYGRFDRREAPQYYADVERDENQA